MATWAIDFDGVIHDRAHPITGRRMGPPMEGAKEALISLKRRKHTIIVHTTMGNTPSGIKAVEEWMKYYDIPYDKVLAKPFADVYLDDRAIRFTDWKESNVHLSAPVRQRS